MVAVFRRFSRKNSDGSPSRKLSRGSQHDSSISQDSSSSQSTSLNVSDKNKSRSEIDSIVRSCIQQLKSQQEGEVLNALKSLFSLSSSEDNGASSRKREMICVAGGQLLPELFAYIDTLDGVHIQAALLVVNNLSTVSDNKRHLAMQGAGVLARLLRYNPSCHLAAIILVNLTFCDAELRRDLALNKDFQLVETLALMSLICSMDELEFVSKGEPMLKLSPQEALQKLTCDKHIIFAIGDTSSSKSCYPNTLKWVMSALKNLTRPSKYDTVAHAAMQTGVVPHVLRFATLKRIDDEHWCTIQDAALYIIIHLAATPSTRPPLREFVPAALSNLSSSKSIDEKDSENVLFQRVKARIALAFLCGSEGYYGQPIGLQIMSDGSESLSRSSRKGNGSCHLQMSEIEARQLLELLANMLHRRCKEGPAGYSASTLNVKYVLFAIRCLLTQTQNQVCISKTQALQWNCLLIKAVAIHLWQPELVHLDPEAAEHAIFSLYLMSNYGFRTPFLPKCFGHDSDLKESLAAKIFRTYQNRCDVTPAGKHAAEQLLLRLRYLIFQGSTKELSTSTLAVGVAPVVTSDFVFDRKLVQASQSVVIPVLTVGACPRKDIFDRPLLRSSANQENITPLLFSHVQDQDRFPSALLAAQDFSFGSTKVRHVGHIDVIQIANNIANSANGQKTQSYSFVWSWQDTVNQHIRKSHEYRRQSSDSFLSFGSPKSRSGLTKTLLHQLNLDRLCGSETALA